MNNKNKKFIIDLSWYIGFILLISLFIGGWIYNYYYSNSATEDWIVDPVTGQAISN